eukprot:TRINITY_DN3044_c0_g1_i6.p2 TRINITY_DN3044_c0_g1~~TRINITY_DN3044_c0_g1_i6.p2  ORF type:complete len:126 (-),score=16.68 TRINITY_DN3044_c0_g1_i6:22-399(-)
MSVQTGTVKWFNEAKGFGFIALDVAEVREDVGATAVLGDESKALGFVEPLHGAGLHAHIRSCRSKSTARQHAVLMQRHSRNVTWGRQTRQPTRTVDRIEQTPKNREIGRAVQQECRDRSRMPSSA